MLRSTSYISPPPSYQTATRERRAKGALWNWRPSVRVAFLPMQVGAAPEQPILQARIGSHTHTPRHHRSYPRPRRTRAVLELRGAPAGEVRFAGKHVIGGRYQLEASDRDAVCPATSISTRHGRASGCRSSPAWPDTSRQLQARSSRARHHVFAIEFPLMDPAQCSAGGRAEFDGTSEESLATSP